MKKTFYPLILIVGTFLYLSLSLLLNDPLIWPDEAIYGDIARNIMLENRLGTDMLSGMISGIENHAYWIPPLFMYALAIWFKIFGFSIVNQRLFSVFIASIVLLLFYLLCRKFTATKTKKLTLIIIISSLLLTIDSSFLKASRLSRPETMVLVLSAGGIICYLQSLTTPKSGRKKWLFLCGILLGLAIISHLIAVSFVLAVSTALIIAQGKKWLVLKEYYSFALGIFIPPALWVVSIYPHYNYLLNQLSLIADSRNYTQPLYRYILNLPLLAKTNYFIYFGITISFVLLTFKLHSKLFMLLSLLLIFTWSFAFLGDIQWYTIYPIFSSYLALFILMNYFFNVNNKKALTIFIKFMLSIICLVLLISNLYWFTLISSIHEDPNPYRTFSSQITSSIPPGKTVFLSSLPDAYYPLSNGRNKLYTFPTFTFSLHQYKTILDDTDYLVFNNFYSPPPLNEYLNQYLKQNLDSMQKINSPYLILIAKLKDKNLRTEVRY